MGSERSGPAIRAAGRRGVYRVLGAALLGLLAAVLAIAGLGSVRADVGPLGTRMQATLSVTGGTVVDLAPVGRIEMDTHGGPLGLRVGVEEVHAGQVRTVLEEGVASSQVREQVTADLGNGVRDLVLRCVAVGLGAAAVVCALVFRRWRAVLVGTVAAAASLGIYGAVLAGTFRAEAITEPAFTGALAKAPAVVGAVTDAGEAAQAHARRWAQLTVNIGQLYTALTDPAQDLPEDATRVLFVSDIHNNAAVYEVMATMAERFDVAAIIDTGDSTDLGSPAENGLHAAKSSFGVPYLWVRGNHDSIGTQEYMTTLPGVVVLDDAAITEVAGLRLAGIGDPRFTPVKAVQPDDGAETELEGAGERLAQAVRASAEAGRPVHAALVHEPRMAGPLHGVVPLLLDGHTHHRRSRVVEGTLELTQGSSGGAGLRMFDGGQALPLTMSVLHFDAGTGELLAVDEVTIGGVGQSSISLERRDASSYAEDTEDAG